MALWAEIIISVILVIAGVFGVIGSFGLIRLKDPMSRLHTPTKATTLGVGGVLIASMLYFMAAQGHVSAHELLITVFLFLGAPVVANFLAKVHLHLHERAGTLPGPAGASEWAGVAAESSEAGGQRHPTAANHATPGRADSGRAD